MRVVEPASEVAESGRGLEIVRGLAQDYGIGAGEPYLHCSWATLTCV